MLSRRRCGIVYVARSSILWVADDRRRCRELLSVAQCRSLARYAGAVWLRQRKTSTANRSLIRSGPLSQCRSWNNGVTRSYFRLPCISLAAALSTDGAGQACIWELGIAARLTRIKSGEGHVWRWLRVFGWTIGTLCWHWQAASRLPRQETSQTGAGDNPFQQLGRHHHC